MPSLIHGAAEGVDVCSKVVPYAMALLTEASSIPRKEVCT